jgi:hypothetical protein
MEEEEDDDDEWRLQQFYLDVISGACEPIGGESYLPAIECNILFRKKIVNFVGFLSRVLQIGSCSAYQWRSHGGGMSRFLSSSSGSSAG